MKSCSRNLGHLHISRGCYGAEKIWRKRKTSKRRLVSDCFSSSQGVPEQIDDKLEVNSGFFEDNKSITQIHKKVLFSPILFAVSFPMK